MTAPEIYAQLRKEGWIYAAPWVSRRHTVSMEGNSYDVRKPFYDGVFPPATAPSTDQGFQTYWESVSENFEAPSEYSEESIKGFCAVAFESGDMLDFDFAGDVSNGFGEVIQRLRHDFSGRSSDSVSIGALGHYVLRGTSGSRPAFTLLVSGPGGGSEAARIFMQAFQDRGISGLLARPIRNDTIGVIRGVFLPEWFSYYEDRNYNIEWPLWRKLAPSNTDESLYDAMFVWADEALAALASLRDECALMIDGIFLESVMLQPFIDRPVSMLDEALSRCEEGRFPSALEACRTYLDECS